MFIIEAELAGLLSAKLPLQLLLGKIQSLLRFQGIRLSEPRLMWLLDDRKSHVSHSERLRIFSWGDLRVGGINSAAQSSASMFAGVRDLTRLILNLVWIPSCEVIGNVTAFAAR